MHSLEHENLNPFVGVCLVSPNVCRLTLYAKQGSLQDIIFDKEMDLPMEFKIAITLDIVQVNTLTVDAL